MRSCCSSWGWVCSGGADGRTGHIAPVAPMSNLDCLPLLPLPASVVTDEERLSVGGPVRILVPVAVEVVSLWLRLDSEECGHSCVPSTCCHV